MHDGHMPLALTDDVTSQNNSILKSARRAAAIAGVLGAVFATVYGAMLDAEGPRASLIFRAWFMILPTSLLLGALAGYVLGRVRFRDKHKS